MTTSEVDYRVAVPSHERAETLARTTLPLLLRGGVPESAIDVWVPEERQREAYELALATTPGVTLLIHGEGVGVRKARNAIARGYPNGTKLVQMDDDLKTLREVINPKVTVEVDVSTIIREGFEAAGDHLWGTHPTKNPMFLWGSSSGATLRGQLWYIEAGLMGYVVRGEPHEIVTLDDKEDFERSCLFFKRDGEVVRLSRYGMEANWFKEPGGMQTYRTEETVSSGLLDMLALFPDWTRTVRKNNTGGVGIDVRLKNIKGTIPEGRERWEYPEGLDERRARLNELYEIGAIHGWH